MKQELITTFILYTPIVLALLGQYWYLKRKMDTAFAGWNEVIE